MRVGECYQGAGLVVQLVESESGGQGRDSERMTENDQTYSEGCILPRTEG